MTIFSVYVAKTFETVFQVLGGMMLYYIWGKKSISSIKYEKNYKQLKSLESRKDDNNFIIMNYKQLTLILLLP